MPSAQLIEQIVRKVLAEAGMTPQGVGTPSENSCRRMLVLAPREHVNTGQLKSMLPADTRLEFIGAGHLETEKIGTADFCRIILPFVSLKTLADLALGRASGRIGRFVTLLLMAGHQINAAVFEHDKFKDTAPAGLFRLYQGYEATLAEFGLTRLQACDGGAEATDSGSNPACKILGERLITEKRVAGLAARGINEIHTAPKSLITALAKDLAREKGIRIISGAGAGKGSVIR